MRYSVIGATPEQLRSVGALNIKEAKNSKITFVSLSETQVRNLESMGCVVSKVSKVSAPVTPPAPVEARPTYTAQQLIDIMGLEDLRALTTPPLYGEGFNLAILDTGIRETHQMMQGNFVYRKNFSSSPMHDGFDHGTAVAFIATTAAPLCNILNMKVLDDNGECTEEEVVMAFEDCLDLLDTNPELAPHVINLSLGAPDDGNPNSAIRVAARAVMEKNIWIMAAAGNNGPEPSSILSPACEYEIGAIGSVGVDPFIVSPFSSRGPTKEGLVKPDVVMFGEDTIVASSESDSATTAKGGTSFSTPYLSVLGLLYVEGMSKLQSLRLGLPQPPETSRYESEMRQYLLSVGVKPQGAPTVKDNDYGYGIPVGQELLRAITTVQGIDMQGLIGLMMVIPIMGMIMKAVK